jgi:hypothetical protein
LVNNLLLASLADRRPETDELAGPLEIIAFAKPFYAIQFNENPAKLAGAGGSLRGWGAAATTEVGFIRFRR